jgi:hypothetical protein
MEGTSVSTILLTLFSDIGHIPSERTLHPGFSWLRERIRRAARVGC